MGDDLRAAAAALDVTATDLTDLTRQLGLVLPAGSWRGPAAQQWFRELDGRVHDLRRVADAVRRLSGAVATRAVLLESSPTPVTTPARVA